MGAGPGSRDRSVRGEYGPLTPLPDIHWVFGRNRFPENRTHVRMVGGPPDAIVRSSGPLPDRPANGYLPSMNRLCLRLGLLADSGCARRPRRVRAGSGGADLHGHQPQRLQHRRRRQPARGGPRRERERRGRHDQLRRRPRGQHHTERRRAAGSRKTPSTSRGPGRVRSPSPRAPKTGSSTSTSPATAR